MKALLVQSLSPLKCRLFADSAIVRSGTPLFVPDCFSPWTGAVYVAVRIVRLGKCIAGKFAMRYVDAITAVHVMQSEAAADLTYIADEAIIYGETLDIASAGETVRLSVTDGSGTTEKAISLAELNIPAAIAALSQLATFKTGDLVIFSDSAMPTDLESTKDKYIEAAINDCRCVKFKVK